MSLFLNLLFPKKCYGCGRLGKYLCSQCLAKLSVKAVKINSKNQFDGQLSLFRYDGFIKSAIHNLKYNFVTDLCDELVKLSVFRLKSDFPHLLSYWRENRFILSPIPLHHFRQNWRGFNQSEVLANTLAKKLKLDYSILLCRIKNTPSQTSFRDRTKRKSNVSGIFKLLPQQAPLNIILFDDVATTGSTLLSAASIFPHNSRIWTLTIAG